MGDLIATPRIPEEPVRLVGHLEEVSFQEKRAARLGSDDCVGPQGAVTVAQADEQHAPHRALLWR